MRNQPLVRLRLGLLAGACALFALGAVGAKAQQAQDESDEDTFEQRIIKNILGGMGVDIGRPGIDYRERSPLVIPPSLDLPPPDSADLGVRNPAWPRDPETVKKKKVAVQNRPNTASSMDDPGGSSRMTPDELRRGATARASSRVTDPSKSGSVDDPNIGRPSTPRELGSSSIFNWRALTGQYAPETANFEGEPSRGTLTQPPPGYQTPSTNFPYGIQPEQGGGWKVPTILDRPVGQDK